MRPWSGSGSEKVSSSFLECSSGFLGVSQVDLRRAKVEKDDDVRRRSGILVFGFEMREECAAE